MWSQDTFFNSLCQIHIKDETKVRWNISSIEHFETLKNLNMMTFNFLSGNLEIVLSGWSSRAVNDEVSMEKMELQSTNIQFWFLSQMKHFQYRTLWNLENLNMMSDDEMNFVLLKMTGWDSLARWKFSSWGAFEWALLVCLS
jgi:hypothetical protein